MNMLPSPAPTRAATAGRAMRAGTLAFLAAVVLLPAAQADVDPAPRARLCQGDETEFFACSTGRGRALALCGQAPARVQYRYGAPGRIELAFPDDPAQGPQRLLFADYQRYQTERSQVRFSNAGVEYIVFDGREDGRRTAGVSVQAPGAAVERTLACRGPVRGRLAALKTVLRCDAESALNTGRCP
jgi:hypothetical protein